MLLEVFEAEAEARRQRRIVRLRRAARLPPGKTFETLDTGRLPAPVVQQLKTLATGTFLETATNVLAFGLPGVGKSHALCAVGHALVEAGHSLLRHVSDFPILDNRHCTRDGVPRFPGTGRAVEDRVQGMPQPKGWRRRSGALRRPPDDGLSIQPSARPIHAASPRLFE